MATRTPLVQSVERCIEILDAIAGAEDGLGIAELARHVRLKQPTVHNLVRTLVSRGVLLRLTEPTRYKAGPRLAEWAASTDGHTLRRHAARAMLTMQAELPQSSYNFSERTRDGEIEHVLILNREQPGVIERPVGRRCHPYSSGHTLVFEAFGPEVARAAYRERYPFVEYGESFWGSIERLEAFLAQTRAAGYALPPLRSERQFRVVAPVFSGGLSPALVAQLGGFMDDDQPETTKQCLVTLVTRMAKGLSGPLLPPA